MIPSVRLRRSIADGIQAVNIAATVVCLLIATAARAHPEYAPSTVNHYVKLDLVAPDELRLAYTVMVGPAPAAAWRRAADANHDGTLDDAETGAIGARARAAVLAALSLTVDGKTVVPAFDAPAVGLAGSEVAPSAFSVDLVARVPLAGAPPHTVRVDDATSESQLGEIEVRVEESPSTRLLESHRGPSGSEKETRFLFRGPKFSALEDRSISLRFDAAARAPAAEAAPPSSRRGWWWWLLLGTIAVAGVAVALSRRRR